MNPRARLWQRPNFTSGGNSIEFDLFCFARQPLTTALGSALDDDWCPYGEMPEWLELITLRRDQPEAQPLFEKLVGFGGSKPLGADSIRDLPSVLEQFNVATHCCNVVLKLADAPDLGHLQMAWATVRWLMRGGAFAVFDDASKLWHLADEVMSWPSPLALSMGRETRISYETDHAAGRGHMMHTRGMKKFGRPDLVIELPPEQGLRWQVDQAHQLISALSEATALGHLFKPGRKINLGEAVFSLAQYEPDVNAPDVFLQNDGLLLKPIGHMDTRSSTGLR